MVTLTKRSDGSWSADFGPGILFIVLRDEWLRELVVSATAVGLGPRDDAA